MRARLSRSGALGGNQDRMEDCFVMRGTPFVSHLSQRLCRDVRARANVWNDAPPNQAVPLFCPRNRAPPRCTSNHAGHWLATTNVTSLVELAPLADVGARRARRRCATTPSPR